MPTLSTSPTYVVPGKKCSVIFTLTGGSSNYVRAWMTVAPENSELDTKLKADNLHRVLFYEGDGGATHPLEYTFDVGGKYTLSAQEITRGSTYGGGYFGDPNSAATETVVSTTTLYVYVGQKLRQPVGASPNTANLELYVWNDTIRQTQLGVHGETTPAIVQDNPTPATKTAIETAATTTAVAAMVDVSVNSAVGTISTIVSNMVTKINAHLALGSTTHNAADSDNTIKVEYGSAPSPQTLVAFVNEALKLLKRHYTNDCGGTTSINPGVGSAAYHKVGGVAKADLTNVPLHQSVSTLGEAYSALADIWRSYEAHRASTAVHGTADSTNTLTALPTNGILLAHKAFYDSIASMTPTAPPAAQSGVVTLLSQAGFIEA